MNPGNSNTAKWELLLSGNEADMYNCFQYCYDDLYRFGLYLYKDPELVKECIHLLFIEIWKMKGRLGAISHIKEYVLTIYKRILYKQKNGLVKHWSKISDIESAAMDNELYTSAYEEMMIDAQENRLMRQKLQAALPVLGERQRELIRLRYFEEKSIEDIAAITSLSHRTIYNTIYNSLVKLRELLG